MTSTPTTVNAVHDRSWSMLERAREIIPGGVNSDVRLASAPFPLFFERAVGSHIYDVDGNDYIDYCLGNGPAILGHAPAPVVAAVTDCLGRGQVYAGQHNLEYELAERLVRLVPSAEMVRLGSSGSEMAHIAMRLARGATGRRLILKFEGHYHGWFDGELISVHPPLAVAGDARRPNRYVETAGHSVGAAEDVCVLPFNDLEAVEAMFAEIGSDIAGILVAPILCAGVVIVAPPDYLQGLRNICDRYGAVLIFDEVITGFRVGLHSAQGLLGVTPDVTVLGKALGGGFPIAALVGKRAVMDHIGRTVRHSGTNNGNVLSVTAALATLTELERDDGAAFRVITERGNRLADAIREQAKDRDAQLLVQGVGSVFSTTLGTSSVANYRDLITVDAKAQTTFVHQLQERRIRTMGGCWVLSTAHTDTDIQATVDAVSVVLDGLT